MTDAAEWHIQNANWKKKKPATKNSMSSKTILQKNVDGIEIDRVIEFMAKRLVLQKILNEVPQGEKKWHQMVKEINKKK